MRTNYVNELETLTLYVYSDGQRVSADSTPTVSAVDVDTDDAVTMAAVSTETGDGYDYYTTNIDPSEVTETRKVEVTWNFTESGNNFSQKYVVEVVRPYFTADDLWNAFPVYAEGAEQYQTVDDVKAVENKVRRLIDEYCRQSFQDFGRETIKYRGSGTNSLQLRKRIYKLHEVSTGSLVLFSRDDNDDVDVEMATWFEEEPFLITKKQVDSSYVGLNDRDRFDATVQRTRALFRSRRVYEVDAEHGWKYLPENVRHAAVLLAHEVLTHEDRYRQKNITVVRSADYRMEFNQDHHYTTGNVDADRLLEPYVYQGVHVF